MIIAVPVDEANVEANVSDNFGRAPYYLYYVVENESSDFLINFAMEERGGAGIKAAQILVDHNVDILLTPRCGENAHAVLHSGNIKLYKSVGGKVMDNIRKFIDGELDLLEDIHEGFHGGN